MPDPEGTVYVTARLLPGWYFSDGTGGGGGSVGSGHQRDGIYDTDFIDDRPPSNQEPGGTAEYQPEPDAPPVSIESPPPTQIGKTA